MLQQRPSPGLGLAARYGDPGETADSASPAAGQNTTHTYTCKAGSLETVRTYLHSCTTDNPN